MSNSSPRTSCSTFYEWRRVCEAVFFSTFEDRYEINFTDSTLQVYRTWLLDIESRRGESFLCLASLSVFPLGPSQSIVRFWFCPLSSRGGSLSLRPRRRVLEPRFSVGSKLCLSTGHSWLPFTHAQSTLYLLNKAWKKETEKSGNSQV